MLQANRGCLDLIDLKNVKSSVCILLLYTGNIELRLKLKMGVSEGFRKLPKLTDVRKMEDLELQRSLILTTSESAAVLLKQLCIITYQAMPLVASPSFFCNVFCLLVLE